jgi:hypothetical protein
MDEILGDSPTNSSPHSIDVGKLSIEVPSTSGAASPPIHQKHVRILVKSPPNQREEKNSNFEYIKMKKLHYEHKNEMCNGMEKKKIATFLKETVEVKQRKLSFLEKKLALEESKSIRRIGQEIVILVIGICCE